MVLNLRHNIKRLAFYLLPDIYREAIDLVHYEGRLRAKSLVDEPELQLLPELVHAGDIVVDIGANLGAYTLQLHELLGPEGIVHSCEPVPRTFRLLSYCCHRLRKYNNIQFHQLAISSSPGVAEFSLPVDGLFQHPNYYVGGLKDQNRKSHRFPVQVESLDNWNVLKNVKVSLVKIDVEGAEVDVISGGLQLIARDLPSIICETNAPNLAQIVPMLSAMGYQAFECTQAGKLRKLMQGDGLNFSPNCLFLHTETAGSLIARLGLS